MNDFVIVDSASLELLRRACLAADRAEEARVAIAKTGGSVVIDAKGRPARNPGCVVERDATTTLLSCLKLLGMHQIPEGAGRQPGS